MFPCIGKLYASKVPTILFIATGVGSMSSSLIAGLANIVRSSIDVAATSLVCAFCAKGMTLWLSQSKQAVDWTPDHGINPHLPCTSAVFGFVREKHS